MSLGKEGDEALDNFYNEIKHIPDVKNVIDKIVQFLNHCDVKGLFKFPNDELLYYFQKAETRSIMGLLAQSAEMRIKKKQETDNFIPRNEWIAYQMRASINQMRSYAEELKLNLKLILDPELVNPDINELGTYLKIIYDKLQYDDNKRKEMNEIFNVNLRNSLSHEDYEIINESIVYSDKQGNPKILREKEFQIIMAQMTAITYVFDQKTKEIKLRNS